MKIGIFETEHFEGAYPVIRLFDTPQNELFIFTDNKTYKRFADLFGTSTSRYQWKILQKGALRLSFFWKFYRAVKKIKPDILYINTISSNHLLFALVIRLVRPCRVVTTVHDINCLFQSKPAASLRILAHHLGKRLLLRWVKELNVVSDTMIPYLETQTKGTKVIHNVPGAVFDNYQHPGISSNYFHLVIPGSIDRKRRDYAQVWALLQEAETRQFPLYLTLLGGYSDGYGKSIINEAREFPTYFTHLRFYNTHIVDQHEFDQRLNEAHFIFIPSVVNTAICHDIPEVYGITKSSGNIFDVIKHAKPFIAPATLKIPEKLSTSAFAYQSVEEIVNYLERLQAQRSSYELLLQQALKNSGEYTTEKVRAANPTLFEAS
ncbi:glycosyltransferase [Paraflavitalea sp. CAU 1676]|uniref:glycosyltransferase n=1 Tax=Paraflavitalea sp. CAU 1676 TaxID=3032598 RepID=UPI0023DA7839|nr:glycosyltransferase [Paraflavitalea sp. CAU 1676]MDF2189206.1 glycosyltransferase [Paraflavitalea sp. CAU 1676]